MKNRDEDNLSLFHKQYPVSGILKIDNYLNTVNFRIYLTKSPRLNGGLIINFIKKICLITPQVLFVIKYLVFDIFSFQ